MGVNMNTVLNLAIGFVVGAGVVGGWWLWIGHKAKVRALAAKAEKDLQISNLKKGL